ncbi:MAG: DUF3120 domain-containing protein [Coleofasciculaceae cyanobacterium SM2_1_6]|nr:DUF3120 domain-containing protein [Coleofasciculaceae cyanobacterium SM2_1_6]
MINNSFLPVTFPAAFLKPKPSKQISEQISHLPNETLSATPPPIAPTIAVFTMAAFLVSVPVFIQAPLVRAFPYLSLALTPAWVLWGWWLYQRPQRQHWGDLLIGFSWSWLAGSIYWGWLRTEPYLHLPVEAIGLPFCLGYLWYSQYSLGRTGKDNLGVGYKSGFLSIGLWFYLGSLLGTALTDLYFYVNQLIPYWRAVMAGEPTAAAPTLHQALAQINNPLGWISALGILTWLLVLGIYPLKQATLPRYAFSGAILSTILVDGLFWLVASLA